MKKLSLLLSLFVFTVNLGAVTQVWYANSRGDNYYPKTNVMEAALVSIIGQQKTNSFLTGTTIPVTAAQRQALTLPSHVTTITNYNPKATTTPTTTTRTARAPRAASAPRAATRTSTRRAATRTTPARATATRITRAAAPRASRAPAPAPTYTPKPAPTYTAPAPTPAPTIESQKIQVLETKVEQLTNIVLQLQQQLAG